VVLENGGHGWVQSESWAGKRQCGKAEFYETNLPR